MQTQSKLDSKIQYTFEADLKAIAVLASNQLQLHALAALYSSIDKMAWLSIPGEDNAGQDFKDWVDRYLIAGRQVAYTADDLWAARCGLLHTGAAESRDYRKNNAKLVYYPANKQLSDAQIMARISPFLATQGIASERIALVPYHQLLVDYADALSRFGDAMVLDAKMHRQAAEKAGLQLSFHADK